MTSDQEDAAPAKGEEETSEANKVISLRDLKLERVPVELPDGGTVHVFPYLSAGAMAAASAADEDARILKAILVESVEDKSVLDTTELSDADWDCIAQHFLRAISQDETDCERILGMYRADVEASGSHAGAFGRSLKATEEWKAHQESMEREVASIQRMVREHESAATALMRRLDLPKFNSPVIDSLSLVERYSIQIPKVHLEFQTSIGKALSQAKLLAGLAPPTLDLKPLQLDLPNPMQGMAEQIQRQIGGFKAIQDLHLKSFDQISSVIDACRTPNLGALTGVASLNDAIASSITQTLAANRLFSSTGYLSPPRIRAEILRPDDPTEWVDELEDSEVAIVAETVADRETITDIVRQEMEKFRQDVQPEMHPVLHQFIESMTNPKAFLDVLRRFALRVAREDSRLFWSEYGSKFNSKPESIGKSLFGNFLEGYCRGNALVTHELRFGEGYVDVLVFFMNKTYIVELKVVGAGWGFGKAESGLNQLGYYDDLYPDAELFMVVFDGRKTDGGKQFPDECKLDNGKTATVLSVPIFSIAPTRK